MSLPFILRTDWRRWFEEACPKCRKIVLEFILKHSGKKLKESLLRGIQPTINIPGLEPIWDKLCQRDRELLIEYTTIDLPEPLKEQALRGRTSTKKKKGKKIAEV